MNEKVLNERMKRNDKSEAERLARKYAKGDEKNGIFKDPQKAREYFRLAGMGYRKRPETEDPHEADYYLRGSAQDLAVVKTFVNELIQKYGDPGNELGLYVPMNNLMYALVGSCYYDGNLLSMNTNDPECVILHAEANKMTPLLYALRQAFPHLNITMRNRKVQLKAIKHVQELAKDYQKNKKPIEKELLKLFKSYGIPLKKNDK